MPQPSSRAEPGPLARAPESPVQPEALIRTKLFIPPVRIDHVPRPRLVARLEAALASPLTVLSAPAGFGKTSLLSEWLDQRDSPPPEATSPLAFLMQPCQAAWLSLDEHDNNPQRFGTYLLAALQTLEFNFDVRRPASASAPLDPMLADLINEIADLPDDFALILDDYHAITNPAIHGALTFLIEHMPLQLHLVIATRTDPSDLPVAKLRARGQLLELRAGDLRFTPGEAAAFLNGTMRLPLSDAEATSLAARTEGWVAGLQLAALALAQTKSASEPRPDPVMLDSFTGSHRYIVDYLAEQVLEQQPEPVRSFLLDTSILEQFTAPLCEAVIGDRAAAQPILERLERANLFLEPLDDERRWYRYQRLFADFLQTRLRQDAPGRLADLHRRAAQWYEAAGMIPEAVGHALAVRDSEQASRLIEQIAEAIWMRGEMMRLLDWLQALPDDLVRSRPRLCTFHAWILNILGQTEATERRLQDAELALARQPESAEASTLRGMLAATRAIVAIMSGEAAQAFDLSQRALADLPAENFVWRCVVARNLGNAHLLAGQTHLAEQAFSEALDLSQVADNTYMALVSLYEQAELQLILGKLRLAAETFRRALALARERSVPGLTMTGAVYVGLSAVLREWNDLEESRRHALAGIELGQKGRSLGVLVCGFTRLGLVEQARGDAEAAAQAFQRAAQLAPAAIRRRTSFLAHHDIQAQLWGRQGDPAATAQWIRAGGLSADSDATYMNEAGLLALARLRLAQRQPGEALHVLARIRPAAEAAARTGRVIEMFVLEALAHQALGEANQALVALEHALTLAEPEGFRRVFADEGAPARALLTDYRARIERQAAASQALTAYVDQLLETFGDIAHKEDDPASQGPHPRPTSRTLFQERAASVIPAGPLNGARSQSTPEPLSERELDVLRLIARGLNTQEIARKLVVAPSTVQTHVKHLYSKLDVHNRTQAVARARELGLPV